MPKKKHMKRKIYQQRNAEIQSKTYISAEVFFFLTCDQAFCLFLVFASVRGRLNPIPIQSNHLLGNPWDTPRSVCLPIELAFGFCLACKNGFLICFLNTGQIQRLCCLAFLASSWPFPSHAKMRFKSRAQWSRHFTYQRLLWDIPKIFGAKDGGWLISRK